MQVCGLCHTPLRTKKVAHVSWSLVGAQGPDLRGHHREAL